MKKTVKKCLTDYIPDNQFRYYYNTLSDEMRDSYNKLLEGYFNHKNCIVIKVADINKVWALHRSISYDIPELFFVKSIKATYNAMLSIATVYPEYRFDYEICSNILQKMEEKAQLLIRRIIMLSEREKAKQIHDYLVRNVTYKDLCAPYSHESPGALLYGIAVCEGISKTFKYLSDRLHVKSLVVIGEADNNMSQQDGFDGHAWNIAFVDGVSYHIDVTFDCSLSHGVDIRYDYFLLSDKQIKVDHLFMDVPLCVDNYEYYLFNGHYVESKKELQKLVQNELLVRKSLVIKIPNFVEDVECIAEKLLYIVTESLPFLCSIQSTVFMSYNSARMIFQFDICA